MQAVSHFNEHHTHIFHEGGEYFFEVFRLGTFRVVSVVQFGQAVHDLTYPDAKLVLNFVKRDVGVFHHIVQECTSDGGGPQSNFLRTDTRHRDGVQYVGLTRFPPLFGVGLHCHFISFADHFAVVLIHFGLDRTQQLSVSILNQLFLFILYCQ